MGTDFVKNGGLFLANNNTVLFQNGDDADPHEFRGSSGFSGSSALYNLEASGNLDDLEIFTDVRITNDVNVFAPVIIGDGSTTTLFEVGGTSGTAARLRASVTVNNAATFQSTRVNSAISVRGGLNVSGTLNIQPTTPAPGLELGDDLTLAAGASTIFNDNSQLTFNGTGGGTQRLSSAIDASFARLNANNSGTVVVGRASTPAVSITTRDSLLALNGTNIIIAGGNNHTLESGARLGGNLTVDGNLNVNNQDFIFDGAATQGIGGSGTLTGNLNALTLRNTGPDGNDLINFSAFNYTVENGITHTDGTLTVLSTLTSNADVTIAGSVDVATGGTFDVNGNALTFNGGFDHTFGGDGTLGTTLFPNITVNKTGGTLTLQDFNLEIADTGALTMTGGTLDIDNANGGDVTLTSTSENTMAVLAGSGGSITGNITAERFLAKTQPGTIDGQNKEDFNHWRLFGFPVSTGIDNASTDPADLLSNVFTQGSGVTGADDARGDQIVYFYDETITGVAADDKWTAVTDLTTDVPRGEGRIAFIFTDDDPSTFGVDGGFPKTLSVKGPVSDTEFDGTDVTYNLTISGTDSQNDGWNLRANPFLAPVNFDVGNFQIEGDTRRAYWVYSDEDGGYLSRTKTGSQSSFESGVGPAPQYIAPFQGIFFKAELDGTISAADDGTQSSTVNINSGAKATSQQPEFKSAPAKNETGPVAIYLGLTEESNSQKTREAVFAFDPLGTRGDDATDTYLLEPFTSRFHVLGSKVLNSDATYEIQTLPRYGNGIEVPVEARLVRGSGEDAFGTFTLEATKLQNIPDDWDYLRLVDNKTGNSVDLLTGERFTGLSLDAEVVETSLKSEENPFAKFSPKVMKATSTPRFTLEVGLTPLPVELSFFRGRAVEGTSNAVLEWETLSEENNDRFEIEQRIEGTWTQIGSVEGAGTTNEPQSYRFTVENLEVGEHSFRLRQVDVDGTPTYSKVETIRRGLSNAFQLKTYPNPVSASSDAKVAFAVKERAPVTIELYNTLGQRVQTIFDGMPDATDDVQTEEINVSRLSSGVYFVRMRGQGFSTTEKLVVVR